VSGQAPKPKRRGGRQQLMTVVFERPRCPCCNGAWLKKNRSLADQGDGSALWWVECRNEQCKERFKVLLE
jgi:hypothetical protein